MKKKLCFSKTLNLVLTSLRHYAQDVTQRELRHFSVMVDGDGDGRAARCKLDPSLKATCFQSDLLSTLEPESA